VTTSSDRQPGKNVLRDSRAGRALRARHNWAQLLKFSTVGGSGFAVNLVVYWFALDYISLEYHLAATASFLIAAANNYLWNRLWTFRDQRGHLGYQGFRFLIVSGLAYGANLLFLTAFVAMGASKMIAQAVAIVLVTPINFLGNKLWSFRT
jgi:putative flippase GtrA